MEIVNARDSWVKDIGTINADNSVTIAGALGLLPDSGLLVWGGVRRRGWCAWSSQRQEWPASAPCCLNRRLPLPSGFW